MRRTISSLITVWASLMFVSSSASAGIGWCKTDPVVKIDDQLADIFVSAPLDAPIKVTGPTRIVITIPDEVSGTVVVSDLGFGAGEEVVFATSPALRVSSSGIPVRIAVYVPATDSTMPVQVEFAPNVIGVLNPVMATGSANEWLRITATL